MPLVVPSFLDAPAAYDLDPADGPGGSKLDPEELLPDEVAGALNRTRRARLEKRRFVSDLASAIAQRLSGAPSVPEVAVQTPLVTWQAVAAAVGVSVWTLKRARRRSGHVGRPGFKDADEARAWYRVLGRRLAPSGSRINPTKVRIRAGSGEPVDWARVKV
jgi:hypothetical protein